MKISKDDLIKRWETYHSIETDIAGVFDKHKQQEGFNIHINIARVWRQAIAELRDDLENKLDLRPSLGGRPASENP